MHHSYLQRQSISCAEKPWDSERPGKVTGRTGCACSLRTHQCSLLKELRCLPPPVPAQETGVERRSEQSVISLTPRVASGLLCPVISLGRLLWHCSWKVKTGAHHMPRPQPKSPAGLSGAWVTNELHKPRPIRGFQRSCGTRCISTPPLAVTPGFICNEYTVQNYHSEDLVETERNWVSQKNNHCHQADIITCSGLLRLRSHFIYRQFFLIYGLNYSRRIKGLFNLFPGCPFTPGWSCRPASYVTAARPGSGYRTCHCPCPSSWRKE